jgi:hypothetical protein
VKRRNNFENDRGQAMVELVLVLMIFLFSIFGITEFSRALYTYNTIIQSTRAAARWAVVNGNDVNRIKNIVVYGYPDVSSGDPILSGLTKNMVSVSPSPVDIDADGKGSTISQKISIGVNGPYATEIYQFRFIVPLVPNITFPVFETSLYTESMGSTS